MFYHIYIGITGLTYWIERNMTYDQAIIDFLCPYINREITIWHKRISNMSSYGNVEIFKTEKPIDSDWPIKKSDYIKEDNLASKYKYDDELLKELDKIASNVTEELYKEAILLIEGGKYKELRNIVLQSRKGKEVFFICPFEDKEVMHNYEFIIKPCVEKYQLSIKRADEITHTTTINEVIVNAINHARFVIADLTGEKPNCYYEAGYAHAIGKPIIIMAKTGTIRHFDLASYKWIYWNDYKDLKLKLEVELSGILSDLNIIENESEKI